MKRNIILITAMAISALLFTSCGNNSGKKAENSASVQRAAAEMTVDELLTKAESLADKQVEFQGVCTHTCQHGATKMFLMGSDDTKTIRVEACKLGSFDTKCVNSMVKVTGMTTRECEAHFRELLKPYLKEVPNVTVSTSNYKFSVLGEVNAPGTYSTTNEKMTVFEALALAGDMTLFSVRDNVQLMREDATGKRQVYTLDLTRADIANSPYFYIQQNDVLYVKPTKAKVRSNTFNTNASMWLTLLSLVTSITTFVIALSK